jgi:AAA15 family ATPase/GTPase
MLIEFSVSNYRSFKDEVSFSMVASSLKERSAELNENNIFAAHGGVELLKSAAIYGANASGKSNLIGAIHFMVGFVRNSHKSSDPTGGIDVEPFRLSTQTEDEPSSFEIIFITEGKRYRYGFEVTSERVEAEWLYVAPKVRESRLFERDEDKIKLGDKFKGEGRDLIERTRPNALFLSVVAQFDGETAQEVLSWFRSLGIATSLNHLNMGMRLFTESMLDDKDSAQAIGSLIKRLDLGIDDLQIEKRVSSPEPLPKEAPEELRTALEPFLNLVGEQEQTTVRTIHRKVDDEGRLVESELFHLDRHESEGTKKLFSLSGPLIDTLKSGDVLIIDELDARLHPLLTREVVSLFNDPEQNRNNAQLVFVIQDTNLLDNQLMRRDQIWFVEKDRQGASYLYSLAEFKVRNDATYEKDYIQGRYGAIPFLGGMRHPLLEQN